MWEYFSSGLQIDILNYIAVGGVTGVGLDDKIFFLQKLLLLAPLAAYIDKFVKLYKF